MTIFTEEQARTILEKVVGLSQADECTATLSGSLEGNIRFARNNVSTSGEVGNAELGVQVAFGKRVGTAAVYARQALVLVNTGGRAQPATGGEVMRLARAIQPSEYERGGRLHRAVPG